MFTIQAPDARRRPVCTACNYPEGECSGACLCATQAVDPAPTVLTPSAITRLGLQNYAARRLRKEGCRVLCCSALDQPRLSIQIAPPPVHSRLRRNPTRRAVDGAPPVYQEVVDGVRVWWIAGDDLLIADAQESSHAA